MSDAAQIIAELTRAKAVFQLRAIEAAMGWTAKPAPRQIDAPRTQR